jgi:hypothetical protein
MPLPAPSQGLAFTEGDTIARRTALVFMGLVLSLEVSACAPQLVGPTAGSGYVFSLEVFPAVIWLGRVDTSLAARFPQVAEVIVRVQDAQGRVVNGVPVTFELEPKWVRSATLAPSQTTTRSGIARAVFSEPQTSGIVQIMAQVDNTIAQTRLLVQTYQGIPSHN